MKPSLEERFWAKVNKTDNCWEWTGSKNNEGYGVLWSRGKSSGAHRVSYGFAVGEVPKGLELDHLCRNKACVNPEHLEAVTHRENMIRGRRFERRTHCHNGHPLAGDNLLTSLNRYGTVQRACRECNNNRNRERKRELSIKKNMGIV